MNEYNYTMSSLTCMDTLSVFISNLTCVGRSRSLSEIGVSGLAAPSRSRCPPCPPPHSPSHAPLGTAKTSSHTASKWGTGTVQSAATCVSPAERRSQTLRMPPKGHGTPRHARNRACDLLHSHLHGPLQLFQAREDGHELLVQGHSICGHRDRGAVQVHAHHLPGTALQGVEAAAVGHLNDLQWQDMRRRRRSTH